MDAVNIMAVLPNNLSKLSNLKTNYNELCFFLFGQHELSTFYLVIYLFNYLFTYLLYLPALDRKPQRLYGRIFDLRREIFE